MELVPAETSLVVAGAWNAAILTPAWVLRHGLNRAVDEQSKVQVFLPAFQGAAFEFPRYVLDGMTYIVRPDALVVAPTESTPECLGTAEDMADRVLQVLSHTPISGIGHNFEFRDGTPLPRFVDVFSSARQDLVDKMTDGWVPVGAAVMATFNGAGGNVQANVQRQWDGTTVTVKFNFHHPVTNTEQARQILSGRNGFQRMAQNLEFARRLIAELYAP